MVNRDRIQAALTPSRIRRTYPTTIEKPAAGLNLGKDRTGFAGSATWISPWVTGKTQPCLRQTAPYYHAAGARFRAFLLSSSTSLPIVAGYLTARYIFQSIDPQVIAFIIGGTAGLMIYITTDELIPNSCAGESHQTIFCLVTGILFVLMLRLI